MPNVNANVMMDNYSQSGDQTLQQLQSQIAAQTGSNPGVAEQVRDPMTGKLIKVVLTMPESAAANAAAVITANAGVATAHIAPPQLYLDDLLNSGGIDAGGFTGNGVLYVRTTDTDALLGELSLVTSVYTDGVELLNAGPVYLVFSGHFSGADLNFFNAQILNLITSAGTFEIMGRNNTIHVPVGHFKQYYVSADGFLYQRYDSQTGVFYTYNEATQLPPA